MRLLYRMRVGLFKPNRQQSKCYLNLCEILCIGLIINTRNKNCLWRPCLLMDQNGMRNSHRGPSIDASYHISVHLAKLFQRRRFFRNPLKPLCQMNRNLVGSIYGKCSIKIAHFVLIHLQTWPPQVILVSDWLISKKSSPLKRHVCKWIKTKWAISI
jgi:hypothetical protein